MRMNHQLAEPFIITGIRKPKNGAVRTLLRVRPAIKFAIMVQETRQRLRNAVSIGTGFWASS